MFQTDPMHNQMIIGNTGIVSPTGAVIPQHVYVNHQPGMVINPGMISQPVTVGPTAGEIKKSRLANQPTINARPGIGMEPSQMGRKQVTDQDQSAPSSLQPADQTSDSIGCNNSICEGANANDNPEMNAETNPYYEIDDIRKDQTAPPPYRFSISKE